MLHLNSDVVDASDSAHTVTANGSPSYTTTNQKFGSAAIILNGSTQYLSVPDHADWDFGTGDFTTEGWYWWDATGGNYFLHSRGGDPSNNFNLYHTANAFYFYIQGVTVINGVAFTPPLDTWYHIAVTRSGTDVKLFIDGTQTGSTVTNSTNISDTNAIVIGWRSGATYFPGQIDEFRLSNSARYTANFTPQTAEYCAGARRIVIVS